MGYACGVSIGKFFTKLKNQENAQRFQAEFNARLLFLIKIKVIALRRQGRAEIKKLPGWDDFRTFEWVELVKDPEVLLGQIRGLLAI